jgi:hypothetical protein
LTVVESYTLAHVPGTRIRDELKASVLTDNVRRCINISMTSARIRSRAGYGLRTFLSQSLVRSIDEDMAVSECICVGIVVLIQKVEV